MRKVSRLILPMLLAGALCATPALAMSVEVYSIDGPQDPLSLNGWVDEIGDPPFPCGELIESSAVTTSLTACSSGPEPDNPGIPNVLVTMTNICAQESPVWYVADPETTITNYDGWIGNAGRTDHEQAFKIDNIGQNTPLISEVGGIPGDNIFQVGETWQFIIQDWLNTVAGSTPTPFDSIGITSLSTGWPPSTGSLLVVPEPLTVLGICLGLAGLGGYIRKRTATTS